MDKLFHMIGNDKRALILDQFLLPFNLHRYENYFNDHIKVVVVERDPRDVFLLNKYVHIASGESVPYPTDVVHFASTTNGCVKAKNFSIIQIFCA
ncbi:hypothetical protein MGH68_10535 [Erysipelothrix sp. D19-032]